MIPKLLHFIWIGDVFKMPYKCIKTWTDMHPDYKVVLWDNDAMEKSNWKNQRQLQEKYLPAVGEEFIKAGQFSVGPGSTRMGEFGARALRDVQENVLAEQAKALQAGYGQAADIFQADVARSAGR